MKKQLLALSLLAGAPGLIADYHDAGAQPNNYAQGGCCSDPCEPCCVPQPKKCIDCECYTPAYYDLQCDWGAFLSVDFLYWYAREDNLAYAAILTVNPVENALGPRAPDYNILDYNLATPTSTEFLNTNWKPGFRIGLGWNMECDGWDMFLTWTYMYNKRKDSTSVATFEDTTHFGAGNPLVPDTNQKGIINPWLSPAMLIPDPFDATEGFGSPGFALFTPLFSKASAEWKLQYNQIDLELGRKYWLSRCFTLRPYGGLRGAWFKTTFDTEASNDVVLFSIQTPYAYKANVDFTNRLWGVGILGGLQPNWHFCSNFILYSNFDLGLLWGEFKRKRSDRFVTTAENLTDETLQSTWSSSSSDSFFQITPILDVAIGLRWEENWCCDRYKTALDIGWEHHVLFNVNHREKQTLGSEIVSTGGDYRLNIIGSVDEATGNLGMGGLVIRLRVDF